MGIIVGIDDGHGIMDTTNTKENPGKRTPQFDDGHYILEDVFNRGAANYFEKACKRQGFTALQLALEDFNVLLGERVRRANAWGCQIVVSWHFNYWSPKGDDHWYDGAEGISVYYQAGAKDAERLATCVQKHLVQGTPQKDRGIVADDLEICRETKGTAILIESGFMSSMYEAKLMDQEWYWKEQAEQACQGLCEYLGVKYIPEEEESLKKIVLYLGDADIFPAVPVSQELHCPMMKKSDFEDQDLKADEIIQIGGKPGSDRKSTFKDAANLI